MSIININKPIPILQFFAKYLHSVSRDTLTVNALRSYSSNKTTPNMETWYLTR